MNSTLLPRFLLVAILSVYVILAVSYSFTTPLWEAPDEPSHYLYAQYLATHYALPPPQTPQRGHFYESGYVTSLYEWNQLPVYYASIAPLLLFLNAIHPSSANEIVPEVDPQFPGGTRLFVAPASDPRWITRAGLGPRVVRLFSVVLGLLTLLVTYWLARTIAPSHPTLALTATGFMAFIPQFTFITGYITSDNLADLMAPLCLLALCRLCKVSASQSIPPIISAGLLVSLAILTKLTLVYLLVIGFLCFLWRARHHSSVRLLFVRESAIFTISALALPAIGLLFSPALQVRFDYYLKSFLLIKPEYLSLPYLIDLWPLTHTSFWGRFGWMNVATPGWIAQTLDLIALIGWGYSLTLFFDSRVTGSPRVQLLVLWSVCLLVIAGFVYFNLAQRQPQGRLLFPALSAFAILVSFGLLRLAGKYHTIAGALLVILALSTNLVSLFGTLLRAYDS